MKRISSQSTAFFKRVFPTMWFGFLGLFLVSSIAGTVSQGNVPVPFLIAPVIMAGFGYFVMKNLVFDLADEVWDAGSDLVVRNKSKS